MAAGKQLTGADLASLAVEVSEILALGWQAAQLDAVSPPPKRRTSEGVAVRMITGCRWHEYLHPTPRYPTGTPRAPASLGYRR